MKIKVFLTALATVGMLSSGCSETDYIEQEDTITPKSVRVAITQTLENETRTEASPVGTSAVTFGTGHLFFVSDGNIITKVMTITDNTTSSTNIKLDDLEAGVNIENVPGKSTKVVVMANLPATITVPTNLLNHNISEINNLMLESLADIQDVAGGVTKVPLYGNDGVINEKSPGSKTWEATVNVKAVVSRIEIKRFTGTGEVNEYKVDGIFINNYYEVMKISGEPASMMLNGDDPAIYAASYYTPMRDYNINGIGTLTGLVYAPSTTGNIWAYNIFPGKGTNATNIDVPHIIVRLSGVKLKDDQNIMTSLPDPQFLTIQTYQGNSIFKFEPGKAYSIASITFSEKDLTDKPYEENIDVSMKINLLSWQTENIGADL